MCLFLIFFKPVRRDCGTLFPGAEALDSSHDDTFPTSPLSTRMWSQKPNSSRSLKCSLDFEVAPSKVSTAMNVVHVAVHLKNKKLDEFVFILLNSFLYYFITILKSDHKKFYLNTWLIIQLLQFSVLKSENLFQKNGQSYFMFYFVI